MKQATIEIWIATLCGFFFGIGLGISGMTQPHRVVHFLDFTGNWDASLAFVMVGAISVYSIGYQFLVRRAKPIYSPTFHLPTKQKIDRPLILGAALFGTGWGLSGYCPGPALVSFASLGLSATVFVCSLLLGMWIFEKVQYRI